LAVLIEKLKKSEGFEEKEKEVVRLISKNKL